ncbi:hypothetical protein ILYODFUR_008494 [Ilyodon furcidens]|uniref:Uncharacterized protein n=1 Tax=Ilyodon furcidens TaxID=33524 RepID=A0ABV0U5I5_9TELE
MLHLCVLNVFVNTRRAGDHGICTLLGCYVVNISCWPKPKHDRVSEQEAQFKTQINTDGEDWPLIILSTAKRNVLQKYSNPLNLSTICHVTTMNFNVFHWEFMG